MKILITGYQGFIGSNVASYLKAKGHDVEGWEFMENAVPDPSAYDWVIHLGAITSTTYTDVDKIIEQNFEYSMRLLQVCENYGTSFQYASSASVYGPLKNCKETAPCLPKSPYAWSKYLFDRVVTSADISSFGCRVQGFRYFNVFGEYEDHKGPQASIFHQFRKQALGGCIKPFVNSDNYYRDFIYVGDICKITEKFLDIDESGVWNVGSGHAESIGAVAKFMAERMNVPIEEVEMPTSLLGQYQEYTCSDNTKLLNTIGDFKFTTPYEWMENGNKT